MECNNRLMAESAQIFSSSSPPPHAFDALARASLAALGRVDAKILIMWASNVPAPEAATGMVVVVVAVVATQQWWKTTQ